MKHDELLSQVNEGRTAAVCLQWMAPIFDECEKSIIANLKNSYRTGQTSEMHLASGVASLCTIEDLKSKLSSLSQRGEGAHKKLGEEDGN